MLAAARTRSLGATNVGLGTRETGVAAADLIGSRTSGGLVVSGQ